MILGKYVRIFTSDTFAITRNFIKTRRHEAFNRNNNFQDKIFFEKRRVIDNAIIGVKVTVLQFKQNSNLHV